MKHPSVVFTGSAVRADQFPRDGLPEIAFLGRSNVGKSSLLNALVGARGLARVSATPGRTQLVNFFCVQGSFYLVDLPGYGYAKVAEEVRRGFERLVRAYLEARAPLRLCVFLVDVRHEPGANDELLRSYLETQGLPFVLAATKADKLSRSELARRVASLRAGLGRAALDVLPTSAETRSGLEGLWSVIRTAATHRREA